MAAAASERAASYRQLQLLKRAAKATSKKEQMWRSSVIEKARASCGEIAGVWQHSISINEKLSSKRHGAAAAAWRR